MFDLLITGARVIDGAGNPWQWADVAVQGDRIAAVGPLKGAAARHRVAADGCFVCPGFIDFHTHSDLQPLAHPLHECKIRQGVTTEVIGHDGLGLAPVTRQTAAQLRTQLVGWNGDPAEVDWNWSTITEYLDRFDQHVSVNVAMLVPHGTVRMAVMGMEDRAPTPREMAAMQALVDQGMREGSAKAGHTPFDYFCDLLERSRLGVSILGFIGNEENVQAILQHPAHVVGSDGILVGGLPHPRGWGTHIRFLAHYVRDLGLLTWEDGVRHMTSAPAQRLGLLDRGILRPGYMADLVVFDPATLHDTATYKQPRSYPVGVSHVAVNGRLVVESGQPTGATPGRALRSPFGRTPERIAGPVQIQS